MRPRGHTGGAVADPRAGAPRARHSPRPAWSGPRSSGRSLMDTTIGATTHRALPIHPPSVGATLGRCGVRAGAPPPRHREETSGRTTGALRMPLDVASPRNRRERRPSTNTRTSPYTATVQRAWRPKGRMHPDSPVPTPVQAPVQRGVQVSVQPALFSHPHGSSLRARSRVRVTRPRARPSTPRSRPRPHPPSTEDFQP